MKGKVKAVSVQNRSALIMSEDNKEKWYSCGGKIDMKFVRKGECEFEISEEDEDTVVFIKPIGEKPVKAEFKPADKYNPDERIAMEKARLDWDKEKQSRIARSGALNTAISLLIANKSDSKDGVKEIIDENSVIETAKQFEVYINQE